MVMFRMEEEKEHSNDEICASDLLSSNEEEKDPSDYVSMNMI